MLVVEVDVDHPPRPRSRLWWQAATTQCDRAALDRHVFVINLENEDCATTWGTKLAARYLNGALVAQGSCSRSARIGHASLDNYIARRSNGEVSEPDDAGRLRQVRRVHLERERSVGQALGQGCVYTASVTTIGDQLTAAGKTWRAYQEDMRTPCRHPVIGQDDPTLVARKGDMCCSTLTLSSTASTRSSTRRRARRVVDDEAISRPIYQIGL